MASQPVGVVVMRFFASNSGKYTHGQEQKAMEMNVADKVKVEFENAIHTAIQDWERDYGKPAGLFTRNRKIDEVTMIKLLCLMGGNSLRKELYDYPGLTVSASSFSECRAAIDSELLYYVLRRFSDTDSENDAFLYKGRS